MYTRHTFALPVTIEDGCWIGGGVIILPGVTIGKGSVVGAGSVVVKSIPANSLAVGNPCKVVRKINQNRIKLVAFDLDGTIGNTIPMCIDAVKQAVAPYTRHEMTEKEVVQTFGLNEKGMIRQLIAGENAEKALDDFYKIYANIHATCPFPFEGIVELIEALKEKSVVVALVTGKGEKSCAITLRQFNMETCFDKIKTGSPAKNVKTENLRSLLVAYQLQPHEMVYIGDAVADITACHAAGIKCLSAAWAAAAEDLPRLQEYNPDHVFCTVQSLRDFLMRQI